ncbi:protein kinase [Myxococcota bacterium]|nr:protein kinase [Myxococcota bacterium]
MPKQSWQPCWSCGNSVALGTRRCPHCGASQQREQTDHLSGRYLGGYQLVRRIGHGGMGMVYEAVHLQSGYHYALKILHPQICEDEVMIERLRREAQIATTLRHKHLVEVYELGFDEGLGYFLVMELLQGDELASLMASYPVISLGRVREIVAQVCDGLETAHRFHVVHRDLKPGNVFLLQPESGHAYVKLLDFGIARIFAQEGQAQQLTGMGSSLGTPDYMPPEQIMGKLDTIGPSSDIYSLSVMIFRVLTGVLPLDGRNLLKLLNQVMFKKPPRLSDYAPIFQGSWLEDLIYQGMAKHPHERPQSIEEFSSRFEEALEGDPRLYPLLEEGSRPGWTPNHQVLKAEEGAGEEADEAWIEQEHPPSFHFGGETYRFEGSELISDSSDHQTAISRVPEVATRGGAEEAVDAELEQGVLYGGSAQHASHGGHESPDLPANGYRHPSMVPGYGDDEEGPTRVSRGEAENLPTGSISNASTGSASKAPSGSALGGPAGAALGESGPTYPVGVRAESEGKGAFSRAANRATPLWEAMGGVPQEAASSKKLRAPTSSSSIAIPPASPATASTAGAFSPASPATASTAGAFSPATPSPAFAPASPPSPPYSPPPPSPSSAPYAAQESVSKIDEPTRSVRVQRNVPPSSLLADMAELASAAPSEATALLKPSEATVMLPAGASLTPTESTVMLPAGSVASGGPTVQTARSGGKTTVERKSSRVPKPLAGGMDVKEGDAGSPLMTARLRVSEPVAAKPPSGLGSLLLGFLFGIFLIAGVLVAWWMMRGFWTEGGQGGADAQAAKQDYRLEIRSQPEGARVMVQGRFLGNTPIVVTRKSGDILDFVVLKNGYSMAAETWEAQKNETRRVILLKTGPQRPQPPQRSPSRTPSLPRN